MKNRLGIEINIEAEMYVLSKQFIVLSPLKLQASHSARFYTYSVYSHSLLEQYHTQEKKKGREKREDGCDQIRQDRQKASCFLGHIMGVYYQSTYSQPSAAHCFPPPRVSSYTALDCLNSLRYGLQQLCFLIAIIMAIQLIFLS